MKVIVISNFQTRKRELQDQHNKDTEFLKKRSLDIPLLQESEDDAKVASLIRLQPAKSNLVFHGAIIY